MSTMNTFRRLIDTKFLRLCFDRSFMGDWTLTMHLGCGAGYCRWISRKYGIYIPGYSLWIANSANSQFFGPRELVRMYQRHFSFGVTRNANRLPWTRN
jgi:hypothetical protein